VAERSEAAEPVTVPSLEAARTVLLVVDMQNDFCSPGGFFESAGHDIEPCRVLVPRLAQLAAEAREAGVLVAYTMTVRTEPQKQRLRPKRHPVTAEGAAPATRGSDRYLPGAWGTAIADELTPAADDLVVEKPRQSGFYRTSLQEELARRDIETIAIAGVTTNCCVDTTARDAFMRDFDVIVLSDAVAAFGQERHLHDATLENLALFFGVVATSAELLEGFRQ
jgi:nicotinamidase-related amidase